MSGAVPGAGAAGEVSAADAEAGGDERATPTLWDTRYRVLRSLGAGGMAVVWLVEDTLQPGRVVALKRHLPRFARETPLFLREFRIHRQLSHPHIPRAYELGFARDEGVLCPYFTLEVSNGIGLHEVLAGGRGLPRSAALEVVIGLLRALDHVHRQGFVHADIKPSNVLVSQRDGRFKADLIDFGVAVPRGRALGDELLATPEYAAPEVLEGATVDSRSDLYAVGLILYELLEGRRPWPESDVDVLWAARSRGGPPPMTAPEVSAELAELVMRLLMPRPAERLASASEVLGELARITAYELEVEPIEAFVQRLLTVPLPWRGWLERLAAEVTEEPLMPGSPFAAIVDVPAGFFARRLLGPVLDEAAARRARVLPVRFDGKTAMDGVLRQALAEVSAEERTQAQPRTLVLVLENIDLADEPSLLLIEQVLNKTTRLVATRTNPEVLPRFLSRPEEPSRDGLESGAVTASAKPTPRPGVMIAPLPTWSDEDVRAWLHRALGRIGGPWERSGRNEGERGLPEVVTPASLVEHLAALYRERRIVRVGDGYGWRERPGADREAVSEADGENSQASSSSESPRPAQTSVTPQVEDLDTMLSALRGPVPERALGTYLAGRAVDLAELIGSGVVRPRGDGTLEVGDEAKRKATYERLAPARRRALHRRLAQALEAVQAPPYRVAEEWLESDTPLMAVPHLLAAAEARPGRPWLARSLQLVERARELLVAARQPEAERAPGAPKFGAGRTRRAERQELWRYEALILATEARVLLGTGVITGRDAVAAGLAHPGHEQRGPVEVRIANLGTLGAEHGHRATLRVALDLQLAQAWARRDWPGLVTAAEAAVGLDGDEGEAGARLRWARAMRQRAEGLPEEAWLELESGLLLAQRGGGVGSLALPLVGQVGDARVAILESRAVVAVEAHWSDRAEASCRALTTSQHFSERASIRARAARLDAFRARNLGALDHALARAEEASHTLPRERLPSLDAEVELELGWVKLELGDFAMATEHARFAATLAGDDRHRELEAKAGLLEATARYYLGESARAAMRAQEAVRLAGGGVDAGATDARMTVLELALSMQGFGTSGDIMREAAELGWRAQRRSEHARAARAFKLAAEAAMLRREDALALDWSQRALAEIELAAACRLVRPRLLGTAGRAVAAAGQADAARRFFMSARAEVMAAALAIGDAAVREQWLAHPDQRAVVGLSAGRILPEQKRTRFGAKRPLGPGDEARSEVEAGEAPPSLSILLAPMRS